MRLLRSWSAPLFSHMQKAGVLITRLIWCLETLQQESSKILHLYPFSYKIVHIRLQSIRLYWYDVIMPSSVFSCSVLRMEFCLGFVVLFDRDHEAAKATPRLDCNRRTRSSIRGKRFDSYLWTASALTIAIYLPVSGAGCSKITTSLVNISLKFKT